MRTLFFLPMLVILSVLSIACSKVENDLLPSADFNCVNQLADKPLVISDVKSRIYSEWTLKAVLNNSPNPSVPKIKVWFKDILGAPIDKQVAEVYIDCQLAYTTTYSLVQVNESVKSVRLEPDKKEYKANEVALLRGTIRICDDELMIDTGIAYDAPAYLFKKSNKKNCLLKPDTGLCQGAFRRYYYDSDARMCKEFIWGGCNGVVPFETLEACKECECNK